MIQEGVRGERKLRKGVVVSNKMKNTVVVRVSRSVAHAKYGKVVVRSSKCYAHDDSGVLKEGDEVTIMETRPISKTKRWRVVSGLERSVEA
jgi:small subunit ribosomal protein S17